MKTGVTGPTASSSDSVYTVAYSNAPRSTVCQVSGQVLGTGTGGALNPSALVVNTSFTTTANCPSGSNLFNGNCIQKVSYAKTLFGLLSAKPVVVDKVLKKTFVPTTDPALVASIGNRGRCYMGEEPVRDPSPDSGLYPYLCFFDKDNLLHAVGMNPVSKTLVAFKGSLPAGYEYTKNPAGSTALYTLGVKWRACMRADTGCETGSWGVPPKASWYSWASDPDGGYTFATSDDARILKEAAQDGKETSLFQDPDGFAFSYSLFAQS